MLIYTYYLFERTIIHVCEQQGPNLLLNLEQFKNKLNWNLEAKNYAGKKG